MTRSGSDGRMFPKTELPLGAEKELRSRVFRAKVFNAFCVGIFTLTQLCVGFCKIQDNRADNNPMHLQRKYMRWKCIEETGRFFSFHNRK